MRITTLIEKEMQLLFAEVGAKDALGIRLGDDGKVRFTVDTKNFAKLSEPAKDMIREMGKKSFLAQIDFHLMSEVFGKGPKIFRPTCEQLLALENMRLNLTFEEFNTPFRTIVIELPEEYQKLKTVKNGTPGFVVLHYDRENQAIFTNVFFACDVPYGTKSWMCARKDSEIESWVQYDYRGSKSFDSLPTEDDEYYAEVQIRRAILNYCLLVDEFGTKSLGPMNKAVHDQLTKYSKKDNKHTARNKLELIAHPTIYGTEKPPTKLVKYVKSQSDLPPQETGRIMPPHARRGHYRHYRNEDGSVRLRVRIPYTIVNSHLFDGPITGVYES